MSGLDLKEIIELENEKEYYVLNRIVFEKEFYVLLSNKEDNNDILIQKEVLQEGSLKLIGIDSEELFKQLLPKFSKQLENRS